MKGTFTTLVYKTRADHEAGRLYKAMYSLNDFTNVGYEWIWRRVAGLEGDSLADARIAVGTGGTIFTGGEVSLQGDQTAEAPLDAGFPVIDGQRITLQATFGEREGVFDWLERGVMTPGGLLLDRAVGDQGRKVFGAVWVVVAELELARS